MIWYKQKSDDRVDSFEFPNRGRHPSGPYEFAASNSLHLSGAKPNLTRPDGAGKTSDERGSAGEPTTGKHFDPEETFRRGHEEGFEAASSLAEKESTELRLLVEERLAETLEQVVELQRTKLNETYQVAVKLAQLLARRLLRIELKSNPEALFSTTVATLRKARGLGDVVIYVNPEALEPLAERLDELVGQHPQMGCSVALEAAPSLPFGSCQIVSSQGEIESSLDERLERLAELIQMQWSHDAVATPITTAGDDQ